MFASSPAAEAGLTFKPVQLSLTAETEYRRLQRESGFVLLGCKDEESIHVQKSHAAKNTGLKIEENPTQLLGIGGAMWRCLEPFALAELQ